MDVGGKQNGCADYGNSGDEYIENPVSNAVSEPKKSVKETHNEVVEKNLKNGSIEDRTDDQIEDSVYENTTVNSLSKKIENDLDKDEKIDHQSVDGDESGKKDEKVDTASVITEENSKNESDVSVKKVDENVDAQNSRSLSEQVADKDDENNVKPENAPEPNRVSETGTGDLSNETELDKIKNTDVEDEGGDGCNKKEDYQKENPEKDSHSELSNDSVENERIASPDEPVTVEQEDVISIKDDNSNSSMGEDSSRSVEMVSVGDADDEDSRDIDVSIDGTGETKAEKRSEKSAVKSVEKMTVDGDEFLITINEDDDDDENANGTTKSDQNNSNKNNVSNNADKVVEKVSSAVTTVNRNPPVTTSAVKYITIGGTSNTRVQNPVGVNRSVINQPTILLPQTGMSMTASSNRNMMQYYVPSASQAMNSMVQQALNVQQHPTAQGYVTKVGNQTVYVPFTRQPTPIQSQYVTAGMAQTSFMSSTANRIPQTSYMHQKAVNQQRVVSKVPVAPPVEMVLPQSSMDQIAMIIWEMKMRKVDNSNWAGSFPLKPQAELGTVTKFLLDLGHDVVKESVYKDIVGIQTKKEMEGTLTTKQKENLTEMRTVLEELENKVGHTHVKLSLKCKKGCNFRTESSNVLFTHKLQPHLRHHWDPTTDLICVNCGFRTKFPPAFNSHMEMVHKKRAYMIDRKAIYQCDLCGFDNTQKGRMTQHKFKCSKHFKLGSNLSPFYSDVNYCMKNTFYHRLVVEKPKIGPTRQAAAKPVNIQPRPIVAPKVVRPQTPGQMQYKVVPPATKKPTLPQVTMPTVKTNLQGNTVRAQLQHIHLQQTGNARQKNVLQPTVSQSKPPSSGAGFEVCELCGGFVKDRAALHVHFYYAHKVSIPQKIFEKPQAPLFCRVCLARFWTAQGLAKHKSSTNHRDVPTKGPVPSTGKTKCWICLQCPDNIVHHMQSVHAMTFNDLLVQEKCVFCGINIGNKRSMELHMSAAHGVVVKGDTWIGRAVDGNTGPIKPAVKQMGKPVVSTQVSPARQNMVRNNFCVFCGISFSDNAQLTLHCIKRHATCRECGMVVARGVDLVNHSCTRRVPKSCQVCGLRNLKAQYYNKHVLTHLKNCKIKLRRLSKEDILKATKRPLEYFTNEKYAKKTKVEIKSEETVILDISSGDEGECSVAKKVKSVSKADDEPNKVDDKYSEVIENKDHPLEDNSGETTKENSQSKSNLIESDLQNETASKNEIPSETTSDETTKNKPEDDSNNSSIQNREDEKLLMEKGNPRDNTEKGDCLKMSDVKKVEETETNLESAKADLPQDEKQVKKENMFDDPDTNDKSEDGNEKATTQRKENVEFAEENLNLKDMSHSDDDSPMRTPVKNMKIELNVQEESSSDEENEGSTSSGSRKRKLDNDTSAFCIKRRK